MYIVFTYLNADFHKHEENDENYLGTIIAVVTFNQIVA